MRKKFGGYKINISKPIKILQDENTLVARVFLEGNIEIGLEIDRYTWRFDWIEDFIWKNNPEKNLWAIQKIDNQIYNVEGIEYNCFTIVYTKLK